MSREFLEIESLDSFDEHLRHTRTLHGWFLQSVDLSERGAALSRVDPAGAVFLGCQLEPAVAEDLTRRGALIFPRLSGVPFDPYRAGLYSAEELYDTPRYEDSLDARVYAWTRAAGPVPPLPDTLATALHDHAITDALDEVHLDSARVVGVMGGHALRRDDPAYAEAARLGRTLAERDRVVLTGGGPGAMEAANLGAWFAGRAEELEQGLTELAEVPSFQPDTGAWARVALELRHRHPAAGTTLSIGIPTWFYGHEPPNVFCTHIAKYFANALREDSLLHRCRGGLIVLPGAAGTVQEIFQAATGNYYAADDDQVAPMVLVGREHWTERLPAWPLLRALGEGRELGRRLHLADTLVDAVAALGDQP
ncbi:Rossmann fold nucleotide-binding protein [Enemella dayhoffiae]|uniref:Rossmann fold nucleotide-binding protein n=1 Tax=Enemella dayhoffiae TaxID=2016507 RepID=A0A255H718_9ACTN|nr:LOG family protein [Enemella dayhoffiae]OYO23086.1 Rossmann fold nucleotide-binding protein [Enemella dayhoffiae]